MPHPRTATKAPAFYYDDVEHRRQIADRANGCLSLTGEERMAGPFRPAVYTEVTPSDTRPAAADVPGSIIWVSDQLEMQFSNGTTWVVM
jgi:hypothetical protein